ncbi:response regulator [Myxococcus sp. RHSTA-1-4]|uniref:hybrid sensor histidine kinase/response regulator n=1 Tax=Myxococcus sp. RHSTA-1-4 TaxID=2874601 RepID=UPI00272E645B|nr:response regulator [Myxococcus sp. RHSTA-1-4]MBZ4418046.1 response regulator [Myxococcus sp. RHSTA-1-4]
MPSTFPRFPATSPEVPSGLEPPRARILLVDDVPANLLALQGILEPLGQEVVSARSGEEALRELLRGDFACILMDVQMPGLDGLETARLIRARERTKHLPILFVTALSREAAYVTRGYAQGAVDYLLKPVDPDILRAKVQVFVDLYVRGELVKRQALELAARRRAEEELQRAAELEQQLVGIVGHDIRTPLSVILTSAKGQLSKGLLEPEQRQAFERVARGGERIQRIVDLLLDFTRARLGGGIPVIPHAGDLNDLCHRVVDELHVARPGRVIRCEFGCDRLHGTWDLERMAQALSNLLDNALKYSPEGSPVRLSTWEEGEAVFLEVHNEGEPIPPELLPHLFAPFRRAGGTEAAARESLGLGLYIAHSIVQAHQGSLSVRSIAGEGTAFRICLPRGPGVPRPSASEEAARVPLTA